MSGKPKNVRIKFANVKDKVYVSARERRDTIRPLLSKNIFEICGNSDSHIVVKIYFLMFTSEILYFFFIFFIFLPN